ncbi:MAG: hypothetical protein CMJ83_01265 [Planctomycetes bacterium]|nr:hypothetical protein [Planctomycetota bacterium]
MTDSDQPRSADGAEPLSVARRSPNHDAEPIFVVGSVRSGTSALAQALKTGACIPGFNEGNVAALMRLILDQIDEYFRQLSPEYMKVPSHHLIANVDRKAIEDHIVNHFVDVYARHAGNGRWIDKSPDSYLFAPMIRSCPELQRMSPKARFIFCARRGIENVLSRMNKFPHIPFDYQCRSWAHTFAEWGRAREEVGADRCLEVQQRDMAIRPHAVAADLRAFLELDERQESSIIRLLSERRHEQSRIAQEYREIPLSETPWDEEQRDGFYRWCHPMMQAAGFDLEGRSIASKAPIRLFFPTIAASVALTNVDPDHGFSEIEPDVLQLRPNEVGEPPAVVRYAAVPLEGQERFVADVGVDHPQGGPVQFGFRLSETGTGCEVAVASHTVSTPERFETWSVSLPPLRGTYDIEIATQMHEDAETAAYAWARFRMPQLRTRT